MGLVELKAMSLLSRSLKKTSVTRLSPCFKLSDGISL